MTITVSKETESRLVAEARRRGVEVNGLAEQLIEAGLPRSGGEAVNRRGVQIVDEVGGRGCDR